jgi:hypothetical protein
MAQPNVYTQGVGICLLNNSLGSNTSKLAVNYSISVEMTLGIVEDSGSSRVHVLVDFVDAAGMPRLSLSSFQNFKLSSSLRLWETVRLMKHMILVCTHIDSILVGERRDSKC